ncbi:zinc-alpha-2-glycoprotein-like [Notamacropus eugenii]|uniref:zinc-alpha-2-glycoprotein-like n=1 Tax=Notamacropus eugenii TaxID=9315 RepID=UPI003B66D4A9
MVSERPRWAIQLFLFVLCHLSSPNAESHSLQYNFLTVFTSHEESLSYSAQGYLDGELFFHYNSKNQMLEPQVPWLDEDVERDTWKKEHDNLKDIGQYFTVTLDKVTKQSNLNPGSHTFQGTLGCELHDGNCRGFWRYGYDGQDCLIFHPGNLTWEAVHPAAGSVRNAAETEPVDRKIQKAKVEGDCCDQLLSYLKFSQKKKAAFPLVKVTPNRNREGEVTLRCWAYNFFPRDIKMTWLRDGYALNQKKQEGGLIQPSGDGTYQTWMSIDVHVEEANYICHVEHQGRNQTISVPLSPVPEAKIMYGVLAAAIVVFMLLLLLLYKAKCSRYRERQH